MSDFTDALEVLDSLAGIANDAMKTKYEYTMQQKAQAMNEDKWEFQQERDQWTRDKYVLDQYDDGINTKLSQDDYDKTMTSLEKFSHTVTDPKLKEFARITLANKRPIGDAIEQKDLWAENVQRVMSEAKELKEAAKSGETAGKGALQNIANFMYEGVEANSEFIDASSKARQMKWAREIENIGKGQDFLWEYDASHEVTKVNETDEPIRVPSPDGMITINPGEEYMSNPFDIDEAYAEHPVYVYGTDIPMTNQYHMLEKALDYIESGNTKEMMMAMRKVNPKFQDDLSKISKSIQSNRQKTVNAWKANLEGSANPINNHLGREYTKVDKLNTEMELIRSSKEYKNQPNHEAKVAYLKEQTRIYFEETETDQSPEHYRTFKQWVGIIRDGKFIPGDYQNWYSEAYANRNRWEGTEEDVLDEQLGNAKNAFDDKMKAIGNVGQLTYNGYVHNAIKDMAGEWNVTLGEVNKGGVKEITNYEGVMDMNTKLHSKVYRASMGNAESSGPLAWYSGGKTTYSTDDLTRMESSPIEKSQKQIKRNIAARIINNPHWIPDIGNHVSEQLAWNWPGSDLGMPGAGQSAANVANFQALSISKDYFNKAYTGSIINRISGADATGFQDLSYLYNSMKGERSAVVDENLDRASLSDADPRKLQTGGVSLFKEFAGKDGTAIANGIYRDLLSMNENDPRWQNVLRSHFNTKTLQGSYEVDAVREASKDTDGSYDKTIEFRNLVDMWVTDAGNSPKTPEEDEAARIWATQYHAIDSSKLSEQAKHARKQEMIYEMRNRHTPSFLIP